MNASAIFGPVEELNALPSWPIKGQRRRLDLLWLERLEAEGLEPFRHEFPEAPPEQLHKAVAQFNADQFWESHETLEYLWRATPYPLRHFYHGVIKMATGFHHVGRHNAKGSRNKLSEGLRLLKVFTPEFYGLDTRGLHDDTTRWLGWVSSRDQVDWQELDIRPRPRIHLLH